MDTQTPPPPTTAADALATAFGSGYIDDSTCPLCGGHVSSMVIFDEGEGKLTHYFCTRCKLSTMTQFTTADARAVWRDIASRIRALKGGAQ